MFAGIFKQQRQASCRLLNAPLLFSMIESIDYVCAPGDNLINEMVSKS
jgi:hypothetical protein